MKIKQTNPRCLIVCQLASIRMEFHGYLTSLLGDYVDFDMLDPFQSHMSLKLDQYQCVLFSSSLTQSEFPFSIPAGVTQLVCTRTFNHAYLDQIIRIPPGETVYLVNDTPESIEAIMEQFREAGLTQYHFIPCYPGCIPADETVQYAITLGEPQFVPAHVPNIINIGNRIIDIATINELCGCFHIPASISNQITKGYIDRILQIVQSAGNYYRSYIYSQQLLQAVISNLPLSLCLISSQGKIHMLNRTFALDWGIPERSYRDTLFASWLPSQYGSHNFCQSADYHLTSKTGARQHLSVLELALPGRDPLYLLSSQPLSEAQEADATPLSLREPSSDFYRINSGFDTIRSRSAAMEHTLEYARRLALYDFPILIEGETGTQKRTLAAAIHKTSGRRQYPLVDFQAFCSPLAETWAVPDRSGEDGFRSKRDGWIKNLLKQADRGTLLIDSIDRLSLPVQDTLTSILQLGNPEQDHFLTEAAPDIRVIATADHDLYEDVLAGRFREDLFFLLNTASITTIPLRERREDIPLLLDLYFQELFHDDEISARQLLSPSLLEFLTEEYDYPGNVRELSNLARSCFSQYAAAPLVLAQLPSYIRNRMKKPDSLQNVLTGQVLSVIAASPRIGRGGIQTALAGQGISITDGKLRGLLQQLSAEGLIRIGKTRGGCELTELGLASLRR